MTTIESTDDITGWALTQAIGVMVRATFQAGRKPVKVVMHPKDFLDMKDEDGNRWTLLMVEGLPIEINNECEPGKVLAVEAAVIDRAAPK